MKLTDLNPQFLRYVLREGRIYWQHVDTIDTAQGIGFLCPKCYAKNKGGEGTHFIVCWSRSRGVPEDAHPTPGRWAMIGAGYEDLTLNGAFEGGPRSVQLEGACGWHGFITKGEVIDIDGGDVNEALSS